MIPGFNIHHVYYEHDTAGARLVAGAQHFAKESKAFATAETGSVPVGLEMQVATMEMICKAVESSFLRGDSSYDIRSIRDVAKELRDSNSRLQNHMPGRYIREDDPCAKRYKHGKEAMSAMNDVCRSALELLLHEGQTPTPKHIKAVRVEMGWHINALFEQGTDVIATTWKSSANW